MIGNGGCGGKVTFDDLWGKCSTFISTAFCWVEHISNQFIHCFKAKNFLIDGDDFGSKIDVHTFIERIVENNWVNHTNDAGPHRQIL